MQLSSNSSERRSRPWVKSYHPKTEPEIGPITARHIPDAVRANARAYAELKAFTNILPNGMEKTLSFAEADRLSDAFAVYLREKAGLKQGDRVAIQMPNGLAYPLAVFGVLKAGGVVVNTNPLYTAEEMKHQFKDAGASTLLVIDLFADKLPEVLKAVPSIQKVILAEVTELFDFLPRLIVRTVQKYVKKQIPACTVEHETFGSALRAGLALLPKAKLDSYLEGVTLDTLCALQYTGGTTGVSKGAMLSHRNLLANSEQCYQMFRPVGELAKETVLTALPLYHVFAFTVNLLFFHRLGAHNVMVPSPRPLLNLKKAFEKHPISFLPGVNTLFNGLCHEKWFAENPPKQMKASVAGGMALQAAVARRWEEVAKSPIVEGYGLTESSPVLTFNPIGARVKPETIGIPIPTTDIECRDDNGVRVKLGEPGELVAKGPQIMLGYWRRPDETAGVLKDGWLYTGDIAIEDEDGYFKIVDRKKDMILVSGFNVYPNEVEDVIAKHPGVLEVAVIGVPDEHSGEVVKAFIVKRDPNLTEESVFEHCRQYLTGYKRPKYIEFRTELPKTPVGKILRKELRPKK